MNQNLLGLDDPISRLSARFAQALSDGDFPRAATLANSTSPELSAEALRTGWNLTCLRLTEFHPEGIVRCAATTSMDPGEWAHPTPRPDDLGWRYVSVETGSDSEAVSLVWSGAAEAPTLTWIEWGRP